MKKITITLAVAFIILICSTYFGPWDTYRIPQSKSGDWGASGSVGVVDLPTWVGWIVKKSVNGVKTQKEAKIEEDKWLDKHPAIKKAYEERSIRFATSARKERPIDNSKSILDDPKVSLGKPMRVQELKKKGYFYRIPIQKEDEAIGYLDMDKNFKIVRQSLVAEENDNEFIHAMTKEEIAVVAQKHENPNKITMVSTPSLVYDGAETKVGWFVEVNVVPSNKEIVIRKNLIVTPHFCYEVK